MKLFTKAQKDKLISNFNHNKEHAGTEKEKSFPAIVKLFNPVGVGTWWISELDPNTNIAFGYANLNDPMNAELGYVDIAELERIEGWGGLGVERDKFFSPVPMKTVIDQVKSSL
tara:strand:- start:324 stop:665 length:342 start_codon:yes stop_codon:yes gene_type:complete